MSLNSQYSDHDDGIPSYLGRLTQAPLLTPEEEVLLTRAVQQGDRAAKQRLIESNMRLVINIAKTYRNRTIPLEDLIQEGAIGLMQAAERFDPDKGFRFSTYATHWIRQAIGRAIDNKSKAIRLPAHVAQCLRKVERERQRLLRELGVEPTMDQVARAMGLHPNKLQQFMASSQELLSLDLPVGDGGGLTLGNLLRDESDTADPESRAIENAVTDELQRVLCELSEREQHVMRLRFHLGGGEDQSQHEEIGRELKLSRERVRQIETQAIKKLRLIAQKRRLKDIIH